MGIGRGPIHVAGTTVCMRALIGVGPFPTDEANPRALLHAADTAMYQAKMQGKNAVAYVAAPLAGGGRAGGAS